jgi:predicted phage tail protein
MTRNIIFKGRMGELFGEVHRLNVKTLQEGLHAIDTMKGGLRKYLIDCTENGVLMTVQKGEDFIGYEELAMELGKDDIIITPVPAGKGKSGIGKIIAAVALIALAVMFPDLAFALGTKGFEVNVSALLFQTGLILALSGIIDLTMDDPDQLNEEKSQLFNGPINNTKSGVPVPLCYGTMEVGGAVVNFGFTDRRITSQQGYTFVSKGSNAGSGTGGVGGGGGGGGDGGGGNYDWSVITEEV